VLLETSKIVFFLLPSWILVFIGSRGLFQSNTDLAFIALASAFAIAGIFAVLWHVLFPAPSGTTPTSAHDALVIRLLLAVVIALLLFLAYRTGARHDYGLYYLKQWKTVLTGENPWSDFDVIENAYGPFQNLFAWCSSVHILLPKLLFASATAVVALISSFLPLGLPEQTSLAQRVYLFAFSLLSPYCLIIVFIFGHNDVVPASSMALAVILLVSFRSPALRIASGGLLALGVLSKFYPVVILPWLSFRRQSLDWAFLSGFAGTFALLLAFFYKLWGQTMLTPLLFAGSRESKHLSIFSFVRNVLGVDLDSWSVTLVLLVFLVVSLLLIRLNAGILLGSIVTFAAVLTFYKVGHQQFFLFFFLITPFAIRYLRSTIDVFSPKVALFSFAWLGYLSWYELMYFVTYGIDRWPAKVLRHWSGLFYFIITMALAFVLFKQLASSFTSRSGLLRASNS
jgi:hypothetical protein